jgi:hypothetical protein
VGRLYVPARNLNRPKVQKVRWISPVKASAGYLAVKGALVAKAGPAAKARTGSGAARVGREATVVTLFQAPKHRASLAPAARAARAAVSLAAMAEAWVSPDNLKLEPAAET